MTKIEYNGSVVATIENGNKATLPVKDLKMKSDIVITVPEAEGESGGGAELNIAYGDTAPEDTSKLWVKTTQPSAVKVASKLNIVDRDDSAVITLGVKHKQNYVNPGAQVGNKVWMPGGYTNRYTNAIYCFNLETETIVLAGATLPRTTAFAGICAIGTSVYVIGGKDPDVREFLPVVRVIDTVTDTVSTLSMSLPQNASDIKAVAYGDKIYMFGIYYDDGQTTNTIWCFDTVTETLTTLSATLPFANRPSAVVVYEDSAFMFNGYDGNRVRNEVVKFDFLAETATVLTARTTFSATEFTAFNYKGQIYLTYGTDIYLFDTTKEMFTKSSLKLPAAKNGAVIGMTDEALYLLCGRDNSYSTQNNIYKLLIGSVIDLPADTLQLLSTLDRNIFKLVNADEVQVEVGVDKVYKGNADGIGEEVEAALYKNNAWVTI